MAKGVDIEARVVASATEGETALYFWSAEKLPGDSSRRYATITFDADGVAMMLVDRTEENARVCREVSMGELGSAMREAFAWAKDGEPVRAR